MLRLDTWAAVVKGYLHIYSIVLTVEVQELIVVPASKRCGCERVRRCESGTQTKQGQVVRFYVYSAMPRNDTVVLSLVRVSVHSHVLVRLAEQRLASVLWSRINWYTRSGDKDECQQATRMVSHVATNQTAADWQACLTLCSVVREHTMNVTGVCEAAEAAKVAVRSMVPPAS